MALADHSPCDCNVIPVSPQEAKAVFQSDPQMDEAIETANNMLCPRCKRVW